MNRSCRILIISILIMSVLLLSASSAAAQSGSLTVDFDGSDPVGYTITKGAIESDTGDGNPIPGATDETSGCELDPIDPSYRNCEIIVVFEILGTELESIDLDLYYWNAGGAIVRIDVTIEVGGIEVHSEDFTQSPSQNTWNSLTLPLSSPIDCDPACDVTLLVNNSNGIGFGDPSSQHWIDNLVFTGTELEYTGGLSDLGPFQPIMEADQVDVFHGLSGGGLIISDSSILTTDASNIIPSAAKSPYVYASIAGEVTEIIPYMDGTFIVTILGEINGEDHELTYSNLTDINVLVGDEIVAGCVVGKAGPQERHYDSEMVLFEIQYNIINIDEASPIPGLANYQDWTIYDSPTGNTPCGNNFSGDCLNQNPAFASNGQYWYGDDNQSGESPAFFDGGVTLPSGSAVKQDIEIPDLSTFTLTVGAAATTNTEVSLTIQLGDEGGNIVLPGGGAVQMSQIDLTPTTPNTPPDLYTLTIRANRPARLVYACLQDETESTPTPPSACLLDDNSLETGDSWSFTDGATLVEGPSVLGVSGTRLEIPLLGDATQTISLEGYDDRDAVYNVKVQAAVPWSLDPTDYGTLSLEYDATDPDYNQTSTFEVKQNLLPKTYTDQWTIPQGVTTTGDFIINVPLLNGDTTDVLVYEVCISPADGYWPGQPEVPGSQSDELCSQTVDVVVENATDITGVGKWIVSALAWLGRFLDISIECNIARLRETVARLLDPIFAWLRMIGKWLGFSAVRFATWLANLISYLIALLRNILNTMINAVWAALIQTSIFQGAFDNLDLVATVIDTLIALVLGILGFVSRAINVLSTLAMVVGIFWGSLVTAFNDPTITATGMPSCSTVVEADPGYLMCVGLDLFDFVILSFPALNALGIVGIGAIALYTIKKISERVGDAFGEVG